MKVVLESVAAASPSSSSSFLRRNARAVLIRKIGGGGCRRRAEGSPPPPPRPHPEKWFSILGIGGAYASAVSYYVLPAAAVGLYHVLQEETCRSVGGRAWSLPFCGCQKRRKERSKKALEESSPLVVLEKEGVTKRPKRSLGIIRLPPFPQPWALLSEKDSPNRCFALKTPTARKETTRISQPLACLFCF